MTCIEKPPYTDLALTGFVGLLPAKSSSALTRYSGGAAQPSAGHVSRSLIRGIPPDTLCPRPLGSRAKYQLGKRRRQ